jgi:hypothetical protein
MNPADKGVSGAFIPCKAPRKRMNAAAQHLKAGFTGMNPADKGVSGAFIP